MHTVSLIVVTYNSAELLPRFLAALAATSYPHYELIAVDNASTDGTVALLQADERARLIMSSENLGFGRACNLAAATATGEYLMFLNPDVLVTPGWLDGLLASARACPDALLCPTTLYPGETPHSTPGLRQVAAIPGAAMLVPQAVWRELGGFDEHFFMYWEDAELCWRAWLLGYRVLADLSTWVYHQRGGSTGGRHWDAERTKNSLRTYVKLMPWPVTLRFAGLLALKTLVKLLLRREHGLLNAWCWNLRHLGLTLAERRTLQRRQRGDPLLLQGRITELERRLRAARRASRVSGRNIGWRDEPNAAARQKRMNLPLLLYITDSEALGGAEGYLLTLMQNVDQRRFRVGLVLPPRAATAPLIAAALQLDVNIIYLDLVHHDGLNVTNVVRAYRLLQRTQPAVVHFVLNGPRRCAETVLAAWLLGVPQRLATFQLVTAIPPRDGFSAALRMLNRSLQFRTFTAGIAVSRGNARLLVEQYGFPADRLTIIPNGANLAAFGGSISGAALRVAWGVPEAAPLLGVVGRLATQKGQRVLLAALPQVWQRFPAAHVVFIGAGELAAELQAIAARIDQHNCIHFVGLLEKSHMPAALAALNLFVLPSLYEGLSFAIVEALAAGKPIVATAVDGTVEVITNKVNGLLVPPGDSVALAAALLRLLGDPQLCSQLGTAAQRAAARFSEAAMLQATFGLYTELQTNADKRTVV